MTRSTSAPVASPTLTTRSNASRKLLARKALEKLAPRPTADGVEDSFPAAPSETASGSVPAAAEAVVNMPFEPSACPPEPATAIVATAAGTAPQPMPAWSDEDERAFKAQAARRKAAGYRANGRDVGAQLITVGGIKPNPNTTVAVIVGLVAERGVANAESSCHRREPLAPAASLAAHP